jgi:signal transduction histidine kinase
MNQPIVHGIEMLPTFTTIIDGMADSAQEIYASLQEAKSEPTRLDDATIARVLTMYTEQITFYPLHRDQLTHWLATSPTASQRREIERLLVVLDGLETTVQRLLSLARKLSQFTIEKVIAMPAEQLGLLHLIGGMIIREDHELP